MFIKGDLRPIGYPSEAVVESIKARLFNDIYRVITCSCEKCDKNYEYRDNLY